jgi:molybdopterin synthase sulfur carrier subunit
MVSVLLFGRLADVAGWRERVIDPTPATLSALRALLAAEDPGLGEALAGVGISTAVNQTLCRTDAALDTVEEVAFMPPMSGG